MKDTQIENLIKEIRGEQHISSAEKDDTLKECIKLYEKHPEVIRVIDFSRNFGKEAAMLAGLRASKGDFVTTMDVDLQDPPSLLPEMYKGIVEEGYDCVATKSTSRHGYSFIRKIFTGLFYKRIGSMSKTEMVAGALDYRLMTRQRVDAVLSTREAI